MNEKKESILVVWKIPILLVVGLLVILFLNMQNPNMNIAGIAGGLFGLYHGFNWLNNRKKKKKDDGGE